MTSIADSVSLKREAKEFVDHLNNTVSQVLPGRHLKFRTQIATKGKKVASPNVLVSIPIFKNSVRPNVISLKAKGDSRIQLYIRATFHCRWSTNNKYLAIEKSSFALYYKGESQNPLFRYEYEIKNSQLLPNAHIHVHAHRDEIVWIKGKSPRRKDLDPLLSQVHFPVGGDRFRPCFEDFLSLIIEEFGVKTKPGYKKVLSQGRAQWRELQLKAAVRDNPKIAAQVLEDLGLWGIDLSKIKHEKRMAKLESL